MPRSPVEDANVNVRNNSENAPLLIVQKCTVVAAYDDVRDVVENAPTNRSAEEVALVRELIEATTALGNYLEAAHREFMRRPGLTDEVFDKALRGGLDQYERAAEALHQLSQRFLREGPGKSDRPGFR
jgi:hypothetical protein